MDDLYYIPTIVIGDRLYYFTAAAQPTPEAAIERAKRVAEVGQQCGASEWRKTPAGNVCTGRSWADESFSALLQQRDHNV